jgi:uncharacterized glyoxalase superfamily protein PhnB
VTQVAPMLAVPDGASAIAFYTKAFGATVSWQLEHDGHIVAGLDIDGAQFFLAHESPEHGTRAPSSAGCTTVRIELFVADPAAVLARAVAAGAAKRSDVTEYRFELTGPRPFKGLLQGSVVDPFGHMWLLGRFVD